MSFSIQRLRSLIPGQHGASDPANRHSVSLEPEIGFQITIEDASGASSDVARTVPELNVNLIAARHLPALFGFKVVQGYLIKVKLFPGSKRLDSSIQTNSWPKFNENFRFPLAPDIKPSLKQSTRRGNKSTAAAATAAVSEFTPEELFAGQFVVFTVYALLELPPASFNRLNKTYRSLRDKSSSLVQKIAESSSGASKSKDDKENGSAKPSDAQTTVKRKPSDVNPRDAMPPLTISESRRNIGSVTCYLDPKIFKRNARSGFYCTEELWLPIKDLTKTIPKSPTNDLANSSKGVVELVLELRDLSENGNANSETPSVNGSGNLPTTATHQPGGGKNLQWNRMTSEVKRKMGISNAKTPQQHELSLRVTTARMRCSNTVKDELEATAGSVYVKTTVFEHGIYIDAWKSPNFYPSLSTKWDVAEAATLNIPLQRLDSLEHMLIRTTLATKTKMGKKLVLGTVIVKSGSEHMQLLREAPTDESVSMWHKYQ